MVEPDKPRHEDLEAALLQEPAVVLGNLLQHLGRRKTLIFMYVCMYVFEWKDFNRTVFGPTMNGNAPCKL